MKSLVDKGIAYDSKDGKKIMLACELVCAEKLNKGFGSKCLKDFNKKASDLAKNNQVRER